LRGRRQVRDELRATKVAHSPSSCSAIRDVRPAKTASSESKSAQTHHAAIVTGPSSTAKEAALRATNGARVTLESVIGKTGTLRSGAPDIRERGHLND